VYLSSDSDETLAELKPYSTYIVGGLVDKNREKGICHKRAVQEGVRTARLPIGDYMDMASRKVLATNHVNEIMLRWLECGNWGEAFMKVIPKRKGGHLKDQVEEDGQQDEDDEVGVDADVAVDDDDANVDVEVEDSRGGTASDANGDTGEHVVTANGPATEVDDAQADISEGLPAVAGP